MRPNVKPKRKLSRAKVIAAAILAGAPLLLLLLYWLAIALVREELAERAGAYGRTIEVESISLLPPGRVTLSSVRLLHEQGENASIAKVEVDYSLPDLFWGDLVISRVFVKEPRLTFLKTADGVDTFSDLLRPRGAGGAGGGAGGSRFAQAELEIQDGTVLLSAANAEGESHLTIEGLFLKLPANGAGDIDIRRFTWGASQETPDVSTGAVSIKAFREGKALSLLGLVVESPTLTLRREPFFGLPAGPLLDTLKEARSSGEEVPFPGVSAGKGGSRLVRALQALPAWEILDGTVHLEDRSVPSGRVRLTIHGLDIQASTVSEGKEAGQEKEGALLVFRATGGAPGEEADWSAEGSLDAAQKSFTVRLNATQVGLRDFSPYLESARAIDSDAATVNLDFRLDYEHQKELYAGGFFELDGLTVDHPKLAKNPIRDVSFAVEGEVFYDFSQRKLTIKGGQIRREKAEVNLEAEVTREEDGTRYIISAKMPPTHCGELFASIPPDLIPVLEGFKLGGTFSFDLRMDLDTRKIDEMTLDGDLDLNRCKVLSAGPKVRVPLKDLQKGSFIQRVEEPDGKVIEFLVGEKSEKWVPLEEISPYLIKGILTTEDGAFFSHKGFITVQVLRSLVTNISAGAFRRGASTITMQMVKNTLLSREKTISRKLQEMVLTWWVEQNLSKERILTLYFNLIEFGPEIYGIYDASHHYFECEPKELNPWQAAYLLSIIPNPKKYYGMFERGKVGPTWTARVRRILDVMYEKGRLTEEEYKLAREAPIVFGRSEAFSPTSAPASQPGTDGNPSPEEPPLPENDPDAE